MMSVVVAGQDKVQPACKEPPTLSLPITGLLGIPGPLVLRIRLGKYVDLGDLLPEALEWAFERLTEEKKEEGKKKFPVATVADWSLAFATYMALAVHFDPKLASPLAVYMAILTRLAWEVPARHGFGISCFVRQWRCPGTVGSQMFGWQQWLSSHGWGDPALSIQGAAQPHRVGRSPQGKFARGTLVGSVLPKQLASSAMLVCCASPLGILPRTASCCSPQQGGWCHLTR